MFNNLLHYFMTVHRNLALLSVQPPTEPETPLGTTCATYYTYPIQSKVYFDESAGDYHRNGLNFVQSTQHGV